MPALRQVEERDARGTTTRLNPTITFRSDRQIRRIRGRNDWDLVDNPQYHPPISAQAQGREIVFFLGTPDSTQTRALAKHLTKEEVAAMAPYIIEELTRSPIRVREQRPAVYEVRVTTIGDIEATEAREVKTEDGATSVTVTPVAPNLDPSRIAGSATNASVSGGRVKPAPTANGMGDAVAVP